MVALEIILGILAVGIFIPMTVFCAECLMSVLIGKQTANPWNDSNPETVVLIPAHNESGVIAETLTVLIPTLRDTDRVLVVADNCTDNTATVARECGVEVLERSDSQRRGKPYALQFGLQHLQINAPNVVVFLDADCRVESDTVRRISSLAQERRRPVQALNLCQAESGDRNVSAISELGFRFKNLVRPLGFARLGLPCHLMGTGMALPWPTLQHVTFDGDDLAEDMQLGVDLALRGSSAIFCPDVAINSALPSGKAAMIGQRTRWEQGHLRTMLTQMPRLLWHGLTRLRPALLFLAIDLTVPPLSLLVAVSGMGLVITLAAAVCGVSWWPALLLTSGFAGMVTSVLLGWLFFCRAQIPFHSLLSIPRYVLRKIPIYLKFFLGRRQREWLRTDRSTESAANSETAFTLQTIENGPRK